MSRADRIAILLSILAVIVTAWITVRVYDGLPHLEDEFAYVWQAQAIARGELTLPTPAHPKSFLVPFVVDHDGLRFGKYPLGWPVVLSFGVRLGIRYLINPILAGLGLWLTYRLGKKVFGEPVGLLAAVLTLTSPFFLMNSGTLLSHPWGLVLSTAFALSWLDAFGDQEDPGGWVPTLVAGLTLGVLALTRPLTMIGISIPFGIHGIVLLIRGDKPVRQQVLTVGGVALVLGGLHFLWQYALTRDPWLNPYTLWWEYDKLGFGPGYGVTEKGHSLRLAIHNTKFSLSVGMSDLFGWGRVSWLLLPFGLWAIRRNGKAWLLASVFPVLVGLYLTYWVGAWLFGPRYYYEGLFSLTFVTAAGIAWLAGWPIKPGEQVRDFGDIRMLRPLAITAVLALLVAANLIFYTPVRVGSKHGLYTIEKSRIEPFLTPEAQELTPALVIVHADRWMEYGALLDLASPFYDTPFIFTWSRGPGADNALAPDFPERGVYHYYPDEPYKFYTAERPP
jgi:hypothetical protein